MNVCFNINFIFRHLIIALFFLSCNNDVNNNTIADNNNEKVAEVKDVLDKLDTVKINHTIIVSKPQIFETAFFEGIKIKEDSSILQFYAVDIGKINIESGKIIACDPIVMYNEKPFSQMFPIGKFPVQLAIAKTKNDERIAFSRVLFSEKPVVKWEFAIQEKQKQISIFGEEMYSYGVDGGLGLFIDSTANEVFNKISDKDKEIWNKVFSEETEKHSRTTWSYALYEFGGHNLATFSTGYGDGSYATYIGFDKNGNPCRLLTDFDLINWNKSK